MLEEISAAVLFLMRLVGRNGSNLNSKHLAEFGARLSKLLVERFDGHWFPECPCRGQGYRCIRVNEFAKREELLERAARDCGIAYEDLRLPVEFTIWVDPREVCCRFGEHKGSYCTVASFQMPNEVSNHTVNVFHDNLQASKKQTELGSHETMMRSRFQPDECSARMSYYEDDHHRLDYTNFLLVTQPPCYTKVYHSLHGDHHQWLEKYQVQT